MDHYITGAAIKRLREGKGLTQAELGDLIGVSDKAVSKWETAKGLPDISLMEPLSKALGVSVMELLSGNAVSNRNRAGNLLRTNFYVCPICGNVLLATGEAVVSCCGVTLPKLEAEPWDETHTVNMQPVEDEFYLTVEHEMTKTHYISFLAYVTADRAEVRKLYPEGEAAVRMSLRGRGYLYLYCNRHGLMKKKL